VAQRRDEVGGELVVLCAFHVKLDDPSGVFKKFRVVLCVQFVGLFVPLF